MLLLIATYYYRSKQENAKFVRTPYRQFIQKCKFDLFDIKYGWKVQLFFKKHTFGHI